MRDNKVVSRGTWRTDWPNWPVVRWPRTVESSTDWDVDWSVCEPLQRRDVKLDCRRQWRDSKLKTISRADTDYTTHFELTSALSAVFGRLCRTRIICVCRDLKYNVSTTKYSFLYIGWQWRNFFISYLCQLFFRHVLGQELLNVSYSDITFYVR